MQPMAAASTMVSGFFSSVSGFEIELESYFRIIARPGLHEVHRRLHVAGAPRAHGVGQGVAVAAPGIVHGGLQALALRRVINGIAADGAGGAGASLRQGARPAFRSGTPSSAAACSPRVSMSPHRSGMPPVCSSVRSPRSYASMAQAMVAPALIVSMPRSLQTLPALHTAARSGVPSRLPKDTTVSYSGPGPSGMAIGPFIDLHDALARHGAIGAGAGLLQKALRQGAPGQRVPHLLVEIRGPVFHRHVARCTCGLQGSLTCRSHGAPGI